MASLSSMLEDVSGSGVFYCIGLQLLRIIDRNVQRGPTANDLNQDPEYALQLVEKCMETLRGFMVSFMLQHRHDRGLRELYSGFGGHEDSFETELAHIMMHMHLVSPYTLCVLLPRAILANIPLLSVRVALIFHADVNPLTGCPRRVILTNFAVHSESVLHDEETGGHECSDILCVYVKRAPDASSVASLGSTSSHAHMGIIPSAGAIVFDEDQDKLISSRKALDKMDSSCIVLDFRDQSSRLAFITSVILASTSFQEEQLIQTSGAMLDELDHVSKEVCCFLTMNEFVTTFPEHEFFNMDIDFADETDRNKVLVLHDAFCNSQNAVAVSLSKFSATSGAMILPFGLMLSSACSISPAKSFNRDT
jgi:hypothetical protein